MSYPYGPPQQPGHPVPHPAPAPGYPGPGYPPPSGHNGYGGYNGYGSGYGYPQPAPSGGTGITAGILALLGGVVSAITAVSMFITAFTVPGKHSASGAELATGARRRGSGSSHSGSHNGSGGSDVDGEFLTAGMLYTIVALVLLIGGFLLLRRSNTGRTMVMIGCVGILLISVLLAGGLANGLLRPGMGGAIFALITLILAALGSTRRWVQVARTPAMPVMHGYGPAPYGYH